MKKVLALVLAVMMMSTFAFAASAFTTSPGKSITIKPADFTPDKEGVEALASTTNLTTDNFTVSKVSWDKGRTLVDSVKINDDEKVVKVKLKSNYTLEKDSELNGAVTIRNKDSRNTYTFKVVEVVNNDSKDIELGSVSAEFVVDTENKAAQYIVYTVEADDGYGTLVVSGADFEVEGRVYDGEKFYLHANLDFNKDILLANEDVDTDIYFLNFVAKPTFKAQQTVSLFVDEDVKVYENKDGKLTEIKGKYDKDTGAFTFTTRTLGNYVWADKALKSVAGSTTAPSEGNPDTGANDVVGIATALAAVALVSAAAISLKK